MIKMIFDTIHIFGFGDVQMIGEKNKTVKANELTNLNAFIDHIKALKPENVTLADYHVIHVFNNSEIRYLGRSINSMEDRTTFIIKFNEINVALLDSLVKEIDEFVIPEQSDRTKSRLTRMANRNN